MYSDGELLSTGEYYLADDTYTPPGEEQALPYYTNKNRLESI